MPNQTCSVIIAAFNEAPAIGDLVAAIRGSYTDMQVVVIDDGSSDATASTAAHAGGAVIHHPYNIGNGAAVKSGIRAAQGDILIFMDADGQHDPADISRLLEQMDRYDMVVGARDSSQQASVARGAMNRIFNRLAAYVTGFAVRDLTSGFRAVRADMARDMLPMLPNSYSWPTTMTLVLLRSGMSLKYVPINARPRRYGYSCIRPVRDSARFFMIILKICTLYSPFRIFLPVSLIMALMGVINYAYTFWVAGRFTNMSALLFTTSVIVFMLGLVSEQISQIGLLRRQVQPMERAGSASKPDQPTGPSE